MKPKDAENKFEKSIRDLEHALKQIRKGAEEPLYYAAISKYFEIALEYSWKELKNRAVEEGLEVYSPKEAIKQGGRLGLIENVEQWLGFLDDRNLAVHDYLGVSEQDYLETIQTFLPEAKKLLQKTAGKK